MLEIVGSQIALADNREQFDGQVAALDGRGYVGLEMTIQSAL